ncbi:MAG: aldo/keto reductase [Candidatus Omnitrophota bacterium]|jgi:predicted aldo/keto reductase-like oxidoreductase|nr:MAG: aldo/keto reductase [Candidatus Omnitrophota bacterium]
MSQLTRRHFIRSGIAAVAATAMPGWALDKPKRTATDWIPLGNSGIRITRLGMGTGSNSGNVQMALSEQEFIKVVRHAYDRGVRFFDTADSYGRGAMQARLAKALKGLDRDTYVVQTKMRRNGNPQADIDRFRREWDTDYFDLFLLHYCTTPNWPDELRKNMDLLSEAKEKQQIRTKGASIHGLKALRAMAGCDWMDTALLRVNHDGTAMDNEDNDDKQKGVRPECVRNIKVIHDKGTGVVGMKLIGNGNFTDPAQREASFKYVMGLDCVDAVTIGFKSTQEVDEAIELMNRYL